MNYLLKKQEVKRFVRLAAKFVWGASLVVCLPGCIDIRDINSSDSHAPFYAMRLTKKITERQVIELSHAQSTGASVEHFPVDSQVVLEGGDIDFDSPTNLGVDYTLASSSLMYGFKAVRAEWLRMNVYVGIRRTEMELDLSGESVGRHLENTSFGGTGSMELLMPLVDRLSLAYRLSISSLTVNDRALSLYNQATLNYSPVPHVNIFAGWHEWEYENREHLSGIYLDMEGPAVGLQLLF